jgi:hypothetical protein
MTLMLMGAALVGAGVTVALAGLVFWLWTR